MENIKCAHTKLVDISSLVPNPRNANAHPKRQIELLAKIIKHQGQRSPVVVSNRSGFIVKGHGRVEAMTSIGWTQVAIDYQDYESEAQEFQDMNADNEIARMAKLNEGILIDGLHDLELEDSDFELLGLDDFELPIDVDKDDIEDDVPTDVETRCKPGDLWILGEHRLLCGDSTSMDAVDKLMGGEKADMVFTDPPYGMSVVKKDGNNNGLGQATDGVVGVTARGKYKEVIGDDSNQTALDCFALCSTLDVPLQIWWGANFYASGLPDNSAWICWDKENGEGFFADGELAWSSDKKQFRIFKHMWKGMIRASEMGQKRVHPTQKPIALAAWCFENYGKPTKVLDLFGGSGSTLIACEKTDRKCFMMELDPHYCDVIIKRFEDYSNKTAKLDGQ